MDLDQQGLQPGGGCLRLGGFGFDLVPECLLLALDGVEHTAVRLHGELAGNEVVAGVAVRHLNDIILLSLRLDICQQYNFHTVFILSVSV